MLNHAVADSQTHPPRVDPTTVTRLPLPSHITVWAAGRWRRGWLIARSHEPTGWVGLVQYDDDHGIEVTEQIAAEQIAAADCWLADNS